MHRRFDIQLSTSAAPCGGEPRPAGKWGESGVGKGVPLMAQPRDPAFSRFYFRGKDPEDSYLRRAVLIDSRLFGVLFLPFATSRGALTELQGRGAYLGIPGKLRENRHGQLLLFVDAAIVFAAAFFSAGRLSKRAVKRETSAHTSGVGRALGNQ